MAEQVLRNMYQLQKANIFECNALFPLTWKDRYGMVVVRLSPP
jgi:hypothetical protein